MKEDLHKILKAKDLSTGALQDFHQQHQYILSEYWERVDEFNQGEISREYHLARSNSLRLNSTQESSRDWLPLHIPALLVEKKPLTQRALKSSYARTSDEIKSIVVHTGSKDGERTIRVLDDRDLAGHYTVDFDGRVLLMYPISQKGAHATVANANSVAIDLSYGNEPGSHVSYAQVDFLKHSKLSLATAKIIATHLRIHHDLKEHYFNYRGNYYDLLKDSISKIKGLKVTSWSNYSKAASLYRGLLAHKDVLDSDHNDPGQVFMHRLYPLVLAVEAYEQNIGPLDIQSDQERDVVMNLMKRYQEATGKLAGAFDESDLFAQVNADLGADWKTVSNSRAHGSLKSVFERGLYNLARETNYDLYVSDYRQAKIDLAHAYSCRSGNNDCSYLETLARNVAWGNVYKNKMIQNLRDFRLYLQDHLSELLD